MGDGALTLVIGNRNWSSWSLRPWLLLAETGLPFREDLIRLRRPDSAVEISARSPSGQVPVLRHGDLLIWDSLAILEYLAETYPEKRIWPEDRIARARARAVSAEMHAGFAALRTHCPMRFAERLSRPALGPEVERDIARITAIWTSMRAAHGAGGPFLFGRFGAADAMFAPVVSRLRSYDIPLIGDAASYAAAVWALPGMQRWLALSEEEVRSGVSA